MARFRLRRSSADAAASQSRRDLSPSARARVERASDHAADPRSLWWLTLRNVRHPAIGRALAVNLATPPGALWLLCHFGRWDVVAAVAANRHCPARTHSGLAAHSDWAVRAAIAANPAIRSDVLRRIVASAGWTPQVALHAAANPALDAEMAAALLMNPSPFLRAVAAASSAASADALQRLGADMSQPAWVLRAVAANPACPASVADQLLTWLALGGPVGQDPNFDPLTCAGHPGDTSVPVFTWYAQQARGSGAARHPLWRVRAAITSSLDRVPIPMANELCRDPRAEVRRTAARLAGIPPRLAREMTQDADPVVASTASFGRKNNRRRAWARRGKRAAPLLARLAIPAAVLSSLSLTSAFHQSSPPSQLSLPTTTSVCAFNTAIVPIYGASTAFLPGGGFVSCRMATDAGYAVVTVWAGSVPVTIRAPGLAQTGSGEPLGNPYRLAANKTIAFDFTLLPATAGVAITPDGGSASVIHLTFPASAS
jgi:hypothetical protein